MGINIDFGEEQGWHLVGGALCGVLARRWQSLHRGRTQIIVRCLGIGKRDFIEAVEDVMRVIAQSRKIRGPEATMWS
jgi:hypothetical protein